MSAGTTAGGGHARSKAVATWLAIVGGTLGLHRLYLRGFGDVLAWLHAIPTALGAIGVQRMREFGVDDPLSWVLIPLLGLMISQAMACAIYYALTPDEKWDARWNPGRPTPPTRWAPVIGAVLAMLVGGGIFMGTITFSIQKVFEVRYEAEKAATRR